MSFPDSERVIYRKNPLVEVICQVRFPPILRIDSAPPAQFQERIRDQYPLYQTRTDQEILLPAGIPAEAAKLFHAAAASRGNAKHVFASSDERFSITLTRDYLVLKDANYSRWEDFWPRLRQLLEVLNTEYTPAFFSRIGLRYVNIIQRSKLDLVDVPWSQLLQGPMAGEFASSEIANHIEHAAREVRVRLDDQHGHVTIRHGLLLDETNKEVCFTVDSDFFVNGQTEINNAAGTLEYFRQQAGRLFRWCLQDRLHAALEPEPTP